MDYLPTRYMFSFAETTYKQHLDWSAPTASHALLFHSAASLVVYLNQARFVLFSIFPWIMKKSETVSLVWGIVKLTVVKGSKVVDLCWQSGHVTIDRYWPDIRSVTIDWFLFKWAAQLYLASSTSDLLSSSTEGTYGLVYTLFKSSCRPSARKEKNYCESCWA